MKQVECLKLLSQFQQKKLVFFLLFKTITCLKGKALFIAGLALGLSKSYFFNYCKYFVHNYPSLYKEGSGILSLLP